MSLARPMTQTELRNIAMQINPHIQLRDIWHLMNQFQEKGLAACLNPGSPVGKIFSLTEHGRKAVQEGLGIEIKPIPAGIDWKAYSYAARAKARKAVLVELWKLSIENHAGITATQVRKGLKERFPIGLNPTIRALKELKKHGLIEQIEAAQKSRYRLYRLTEQGEKIARQLAQK